MRSLSREKQKHINSLPIPTLMFLMENLKKKKKKKNLPNILTMKTK